MSFRKTFVKFRSAVTIMALLLQHIHFPLCGAVPVKKKVFYFTKNEETAAAVDNNVMTVGCPIEHYEGVRLAMATRKDGTVSTIDFEFYAPGDKRAFECLENQNETILYPSSQLTCQPDGTWAGAPIFCVWDAKHVPPPDPEFLKPFEQYAVYNESYVNDLLASGNFTKLTIFGREDLNQTDTNGKFAVVINFFRPTPLSHVEFNLTDKDGKLLDNISVHVLVSSDDVIAEPLISKKAKKLREKVFRTSNDPNKGAISIPAYTDQLIMIFSQSGNISGGKPLDKRWNPKMEFYHMRGNSDMDKQFYLWDKKHPCPNLPIIPNAYRDPTFNGTNEWKYICNSGYNMVDPRTKQSADGIVTCKNGHLTPKILPVCHPSSIMSSTSMTTSSLESTQIHLNSKTTQSLKNFSEYQNTPSSLNFSGAGEQQTVSSYTEYTSTTPSDDYGIEQHHLAILVIVSFLVVGVGVVCFIIMWRYCKPNGTFSLF